MAFMDYQVTTLRKLMLHTVSSRLVMTNTISSWSDGVISSSSMIQDSSAPSLRVVNVKSIIGVAWPLLCLVAFPWSLLHMRL